MEEMDIKPVIKEENSPSEISYSNQPHGSSIKQESKTYNKNIKYELDDFMTCAGTPSVEDNTIFENTPDIKEELHSDDDSVNVLESILEISKTEYTHEDTIVNTARRFDDHSDATEETSACTKDNIKRSKSAHKKQKLDPSGKHCADDKCAICKQIMSNSENDSSVTKFVENEDEFSEVDDEIVGSDYCIEEGEEDDEICVEDADGTDDEIEGSDNEEHVEETCYYNPDVKYYYGKNGFKWSSVESKTSLQNIVQLPVVTKQESEEELCGYWLRIFDSDIENIILMYTNQKLKAKFDLTGRADAKILDTIELRAFFGLLIYTSVFKSNHEYTKSIFATDGTGREIFRCVMSESRFRCILKCLRFDNSSDRQQRLKSDPLAAVSEIFNKFIENCRTGHSIGNYACVDEMLVPFRGRCKFKIYMKKQARYGIKIMTLTDARTQYLSNAYIYFGKNSAGVCLTNKEKRLAVPTQSVLRLCKPLEGSRRNVTADNRFSSIQLVNELKKRQITYLGPLKKNKRYIPPELLLKKNRLPESCLYGFAKDLTILSYVPRKNADVVLLLSSMHHKQEHDQLTGKPAMIADYNNTKGAGLDELDKKYSIYSCSRRTCRWPLALFYRILDISAANSYIIFQSSKEFDNSSREHFLRQLARQLVLPHLQRRQHNQRLPRTQRDMITRVLGPDSVAAPTPTESVPVGRKLCYICPSKLKRKTIQTCLQCSKPMCMGCSKRICVQCAITEYDE